MSFLANIPEAPKRRDRRVCTYCEATPAGCKTNEWLRGRHCCEACTGNHDQDGSAA